MASEAEIARITSPAASVFAAMKHVAGRKFPAVAFAMSRSRHSGWGNHCVVACKADEAADPSTLLVVADSAPKLKDAGRYTSAANGNVFVKLDARLGALRCPAALGWLMLPSGAVWYVYFEKREDYRTLLTLLRAQVKATAFTGSLPSV